MLFLFIIKKIKKIKLGYGIRRKQLKWKHEKAVSKEKFQLY